LVSKNYVITAAHCMEFGELKDFLDQLTVRANLQIKSTELAFLRLQLSLSDHDLTLLNETDSIVRRVAEVITHWTFLNEPGSPGDIALLRMDEPVTYTPELKPVCLPTNAKETFDRQLGVAAGWGITEDGQISDVLRQVELNIIPNRTCVANLGLLGINIGADMICTFKGPIGTESICSGDSGGPLMIR